MNEEFHLESEKLTKPAEFVREEPSVEIIDSEIAEAPIRRDASREKDSALARREKIRLQLGGNPTRKDFTVRKNALDDELGQLRMELKVKKQEALRPGRSGEEQVELHKIEERIEVINQEREDLVGMMAMLNVDDVKEAGRSVELYPQSERDELRTRRIALTEELGHLGFFGFSRRHEIEKELRMIDRRTAEILNDERGLFRREAVNSAQ